MRKATPAGIFLALTLMFAPANAQTTPKNAGLIKDKYHVIQVEAFDVKPGVELPPDYLANLPSSVVQDLKDSQKFQQVLAPGENPAEKDAPVLRLTGTLTGFDEGSRGKRYVGFGMGAARLFMSLRYSDRASGEIIYSEKVIGTLSGGLFGGETSKVVGELAKSVTSTTKLMLLRKLGDPTNIVEDAKGGESGALVDRQVFEIKSDDIPASEKKMNELGVAGYRLTDVRVTGNKSANLTMEKSADSSQATQYLVMHALLIGHTQKNMNKVGAEGYRMVPNSMIFLGGYVAIMEKPAGATGAKYEYRLSTSMLQSNAEKHVAQDREKGFVLIEAAQLQQQKVVVSERVIELEEMKH